MERLYGTSEGSQLYIPVLLDVDESGDVYVADNGNKNVAVFSADGEWLRTISRAGQGPGEIQQARGVAVVNDKVYVLAHRSRVAIWTKGGSHLRDVWLPRSTAFFHLTATEQGTLLTRSFGAISSRSISDAMVIREFADHGGPELGEQREVATIPVPADVDEAPIARPTPVYTASRTGRVYYSDTAAYEVYAVDADGIPAWHLTAAIEAPQITDEDIDRAIKGRRPGFEIARSDFNWPEHFPALLFLRVDGHGHLYVYRWVRNDPDAPTFPVDVYDENGQHLFSGTIDRKQWLLGRGDLVYGFDEDEVSGGTVAVAWRLVEPFVP